MLFSILHRRLIFALGNQKFEKKITLNMRPWFESDLYRWYISKGICQKYVQRMLAHLAVI